MDPTPALACSDVSLRVGYKPLLEDVNLMLRPGETLALTGPNGTGKTSLLRVFAGVARPHGGSVSVFGEELWPARKVKSEPVACFLASVPALLLEHPVHGNLEFMCNAFGINPTYRDFSSALERVGLAGRGEQVARTLSTGQKRRLTLAFLVVAQPALVFADEPTNGLDTAGVDLCLAVFSELVAHAGSTLLVASHDEKMIRFCDKEVSIARFLPKPKSQSARIGRLA